ncbi:hypothetical protein LCGC14_2084370 [marine sediment metagenome]|uniref:Uncharacterized protein n=1 Tax=marine sediment metagenome TaxID=412755 RepID=A0A0F9F1W3_9ZZZZ
MKVRNGFVSNSSSSSFVCDICGTSEAGYDASLEDMGFKDCSNGHMFCESHALSIDKLSPDQKRKLMIENTAYCYAEQIQNLDLSDQGDLDELEEYWEEYQQEGGDPAECPICQFKKYDSSQVIPYLLRQLEWTDQDLLDNLKQDWNGDYSLFIKWLQEQKNLKEKINENT